MIDWASRVDELASLLAREYNVEDRVAVEVLLSGLIPCPRTPSVWLILETNWYSRDCEDGWFSFGGMWLPCSLARLRARSPWRDIESEMREMLDSPSEERLFIECDWEKFPRFHRLTQAQYFLQRALRVRTKSHRAADPLKALDKYNQDRRADELAAATRYVLEDRVAARPPDPPRFLEPPNFLYHCELVQRLAPWYLDWHSIVKAFGLLAVRHAYLFGRVETDPSDMAAIARVAHDSIPPWITKALRLLLEGPAMSQTLEKKIALEDDLRRTGHGSHRELIRLARNGVVKWNRLKMHWLLVDEHRQGVADLLDGQVFGAAAQTIAGRH
jgi:hypothetical protein